MIAYQWAGHIFGTNTGDFFLEFNEPIDEAKLVGSLRLMDRQFGIAVFEVKGSFGNGLTLIATPIQVKAGVEVGVIDVFAKLTDEGRLQGNWKSSRGNGGAVVAYPHGQDTQNQVPKVDQVPEQLFTSRVQIGALRLYRDGIDELTKAAQEDFTTGRGIVTYTSRGNEVTKYLTNFIKDSPSLEEFLRFKFHIQEPDAHGINKVVTVDLNLVGINEVFVQGVNESWVIGKAEAVARTLRSYESALVTNYKKFGLTLNQMIFLAMLIVIPAIEQLFYRAAFAVCVIVLLQFLFWLHSKFIPVLIVYPANPTPSVFRRLWPSAVSWLIAVTSTIAASYLFLWLTGK